MPEINNPWKVITSKVVYKNPWIEVREDTTITPTGGNGMYSVVITQDPVKIIAVNENQEVYLVRVYRYPLERWSWELPGGGTDGQDPLIAAKRELSEETGYEAVEWQAIGNLSVCDGVMAQRQTTFIATGLNQTSQRVEDDEAISDAGFFSRKDIESMLDDGRINSGEVAASLMLYSRWLAKRKDA